MSLETHRYTVDVWLHGVEAYPCVICGRYRQEHELVGLGDTDWARGLRDAEAERLDAVEHDA